MTALAAGSTPLDWAGFVVVLGIGVLAIGYSALESRRQPSVYRATRARVRQLRVQDLIDAALDPVTGPLIWSPPEVEAEVETDHEHCSNDDCDLVLCYCRDQDGPCPSTDEPGCRHHEFLCDVHRLDCRECLQDARDDAGCRW